MSQRFIIGCNYWASHAGMHMWRNWDESVVRRDLKALAGYRLKTLRVFPLWPDFQPLEQVRDYAGLPREVLSAGRRIPPTGPGSAGLDETMMQRLRRACDLAHENGQRIILSLITGWMSGRLFVPPALEGRNALEDPFCIRWQVRYVEEVVRRLADHPAIFMWDLGNECNCMGKTSSADHFWLWAETIARTIRRADPSRPVVSGLHGLNWTYEGNEWVIADRLKTILRAV